MAHRSYCAEHPPQQSNERLELLGDAVLGLVVTTDLYSSFPELAEGDLARMRAAIVSTVGLAPIATAIELDEVVLLGKGEESSGGRRKPSILVDCLEALVGAVYISAGFPGAEEFVRSILGSEIARMASEARLGDPKNQLQERLAHLGLGIPSYVVTERGPDHAKSFDAVCVVLGRRAGTGEGSSKKLAERNAAIDALAAIDAIDAAGGEIELLPSFRPSSRAGGRA